MTMDEKTPSTSSKPKNNVFETAKENSIEVYDEKFGARSILTRSARMRKFKFYQYKPIQETSSNSTPTSVNSIWQHQQQENNKFQSPQSPGPAVLLPREDVLHGDVSLVSSQSEELSEIDTTIVELEKKIADLNSSNNDLDQIFDLVNQKNDLLRRQMQLNIIEKEKILEKANEELNKELRSLISIEDSMKTQEQLERQQYLYDKSLALVAKRNELVLHMDVQEKCIEDDNAVKARLKSVKTQSTGQESCCVQ